MRSNILFEIWNYRWFAFKSFAFLFREKKYVKLKSSLSKISSRLLVYYTHVCTLYTYTNIYVPRFSLSRFFGPSRCLIPTPGLTRVPHLCIVCVCVRIHTHTPTYTPTALKRERTTTTPLSFLLSKITPHAKQQVLS